MRPKRGQAHRRQDWETLKYTLCLYAMEPTRRPPRDDELSQVVAKAIKSMSPEKQDRYREVKRQQPHSESPQ
jgi:hypothetical protein